MKTFSLLSGIMPSSNKLHKRFILFYFMWTGLVRLIGKVVCLKPALWIKLFTSTGNWWLHNVPQQL